MLRKTLTILSLIGLWLSWYLWYLAFWQGAILPLRNFSVLGLLLSASLWLISVWKSAAKTLTILSLIGLLLSVGLWGVSYVQIGYTDGNLCVLLIEGGLECECFFSSGAGVPEWLHWGFEDFRTRWNFTCHKYGTNLWEVFIPLWIPTAGFGVLFLSCRPLHSLRRRKRKKLGLCVKCGYDLRASKDRCPECGEEFGTTCSARP